MVVLKRRQIWWGGSHSEGGAESQGGRRKNGR